MPSGSTLHHTCRSSAPLRSSLACTIRLISEPSPSVYCLLCWIGFLNFAQVNSQSIVLHRRAVTHTRLHLASGRLCLYFFRFASLCLTVFSWVENVVSNHVTQFRTWTSLTELNIIINMSLADVAYTLQVFNSDGTTYVNSSGTTGEVREILSVFCDHLFSSSLCRSRPLSSGLRSRPTSTTTLLYCPRVIPSIPTLACAHSVCFACDIARFFYGSCFRWSLCDCLA
jgi:hypothetical protein